MDEHLGILTTVYPGIVDDFRISTSLLNNFDLPVTVGFNGMTARDVSEVCQCPVAGLAGCYEDLGKLYGDCSNTVAAFELCRMLGFKYTLKIVGDVYVFSLEQIYNVMKRMETENIKVVSGYYTAFRWASLEEAHKECNKIANDVILFETEYGLSLYRAALDSDAYKCTEARLFDHIEPDFYRHEVLKDSIAHIHEFAPKQALLRQHGYDFLDNIAESDFNGGMVRRWNIKPEGQNRWQARKSEAA